MREGEKCCLRETVRRPIRWPEGEKRWTCLANRIAYTGDKHCSFNSCRAGNDNHDLKGIKYTEIEFTDNALARKTPAAVRIPNTTDLLSELGLPTDSPLFLFNK